MANVTNFPSFEEIVLECEKCKSDLIRVLIRDRVVVIECAKCGHRSEMKIDA